MIFFYEIVVRIGVVLIDLFAIGLLSVRFICVCVC